MKDKDKTKEQLLNKPEGMRNRFAEPKEAETECRKAEEALRKSEEIFRIASKISSDVVYERDLQTGIATFYGDIDSHLGYEPDEYPRTMEGWREHVHPEDLAWIDGQSIDQLEPDRPHSIEYRMRKKDGTYLIWLDQVMVVSDEKTGEPVKFIGVATNITERKQAEEELRLRAQFLDNASDDIMVHDIEGNLIYVNEKFCELVGLSREELIGINIAQLDMPHSDLPLGEITKEIEKKSEHSFETTRINKDGSINHMEVHSLLMESGSRKLVFCAGRNITERKLA
ncbi:PAS domain-containing protein, partial [Chloroflexota bacterium]